MAVEPKFVLRSRARQWWNRFLLFFSPVCFYAPVLLLVNLWQMFAGSVTTSCSEYWLAGIAIPVLYVYMLCGALRQSITIENGVLSEKGFWCDLSRLIEVGGDEGNESNDFAESLVLKFENGREIRIVINEYEEEDIRAFLSLLKKENPQCKYTYSDVISLESRGLLRFLISSAEPDNLIIKLGKTSMEDLVLQLIKSHSNAFLGLYCLFSGLVLIALAYCQVTVDSRMVHQFWESLKEPLVSSTENLAQIPSALSFEAIAQTWSQVCAMWPAFVSASLSYLSQGGLNILTVVWITIGFIVVSLPIVRLLSPIFVFVDSKSIGMGGRFLKWEEVKSVALRKQGEMGDPLEGRVVLSDDVNLPLEIDLTRVPDIKKRQQLLRLIDGYAKYARESEDLMRATHSLTDIQFTDLWLAELDSKSSADESSVPLVGSVLSGGKYEVESLLGYGGQATTYLARAKLDKPHGGPSGHVVVKELILPNQADVRILQDAINRFERGAVLLQRLEHPQIVKLWDYFVENGRAYLILEYIEGKTLRQVIRETGKMSPEDVRRLGMQMCDILAYLHSRVPPVIHCDLAPDNLILSPSGKIKLVDFDVARVLDARSHSVIAGRPSYTPAEQFRGNPTEQSDIFAFGAILHFLLHGEDPAPLAAGLAGDEAAGAGTELEKLIESCLAFEASDRPASAADVKAQLRATDGHVIQTASHEEVSYTIKTPDLEKELAP